MESNNQKLLVDAQIYLILRNNLDEFLSLILGLRGKNGVSIEEAIKKAMAELDMKPSIEGGIYYPEDVKKAILKALNDFE